MKYGSGNRKDLRGHMLLQFVWVKILAHVKKVFSPGQGQQIIPLLRVLLASLHNTQTHQAIMPGTQWKQKHLIF